jgi:hypothetical protein
MEVLVAAVLLELQLSLEVELDRESNSVTCGATLAS